MATPPEMLEDLARAGAPVDDVWDFVNTKPTPKAAVPVLVDWLAKTDDARLVEGIVRALTTPKARGLAGTTLLRLFVEIPPNTHRSESLRWAVGNALDVVADRSMTQDLCSVISDRGFGIARQMVVTAVGRVGDASCAPLLVSLLSDDDVAGHALIALGRLRVPATRAAVESMLHHPKPWVRKEAKKAIAKIGS